MVPLLRCVLLATMLAMPVMAMATSVNVDVCFNYGCAERATVRIDKTALAPIAALFAAVPDAVSERATIAVAVGHLYRLVGDQTPVFADRAGNFLDHEVDGRMDCIDHSTTTTALLNVLADQGWLRFHKVLPPKRRTRFILQHLSAAIEEVEQVEGFARARPAPVFVPDHVPLLLALCDCGDVLADVAGEASVATSGAAGPRLSYVVDSWFVEHGEPAVILPLDEWLKGGGPNVH